MRCALVGRSGGRRRLRGQGAIHPGDLPAQLPVGACPSTRPREPPVVGPGPGVAAGSRTRRLAPDHRPGTRQHGVPRDVRPWTGQGGSAPPRLPTGARGYQVAAGHCRRHRRGADVPAAEGRASTARGLSRPWLPAWRRWGGCATAGPGWTKTHGAGRQRLLRPHYRSLPPAGKWMSASATVHHPPARQPAGPDRGDTRGGLDSHLCGPTGWTAPPMSPLTLTPVPDSRRPDAAPVRLIVRRVKPTPGSQLVALFARIQLVTPSSPTAMGSPRNGGPGGRIIAATPRSRTP